MSIGMFAALAWVGVGLIWAGTRLLDASDPQQVVATEVAPQAAPPPTPAFTILSDERTPGIKRSVQVHLEAPVGEDQLAVIAHEIKAADPVPYPQTFILYYLPGMPEGNGAWATTHFDPELRVVVNGMSAAGQARMKLEAETPRAGTIGQWLDQQSFSRIVLYEEGKRIYMEQTWETGPRNVEMTMKATSRGRRFAEKEPNSFGEYYIIDKAGRLQSFDRSGPISTAEIIP